jgi:mRNA-degrading endonuclease toxin of MazEF toxin-antitoxin module
MGRYYFGQIVEAMIDNGQGETKPRPAVIIDSDDTCNNGEPIMVVAISKRPRIPCPYFHIEVHTSYTVDPTTGLNFPCWAKCDWVRFLEPRRIIRSRGHMPDNLLELIVDAYDELERTGFDDWQ